MKPSVDVKLQCFKIGNIGINLKNIIYLATYNTHDLRSRAK